MKKIIYILSFMLDMVLLPLVILISLLGTLICWIKDIITKDNKIYGWTFNDYIKGCIEFIEIKIFSGMQIHRKRILGI